MKKRARYMSDEAFSELIESLEQAIQHERGERNDLRVTIVPAPSRVDSEPAKTAPDSDQNGDASECEMNDEKEQSLEELLAGINEQNLHPEIQTGPPVGNEAW